MPSFWPASSHWNDVASFPRDNESFSASNQNHVVFLLLIGNSSSGSSTATSESLLYEPSSPDEPSQPTSERRAPREDDDGAVLTPVSRDISSMHGLAFVHQSLTQRTRDDGSHASTQRKQAKDDIGVGVLMFSLQFANNPSPAC